MRSTILSLLIALIFMIVLGLSFRGISMQRTKLSENKWLRAMADEPDVEIDDDLPLTPEQIDRQRKLFDMNRSVKLGRSKDQDGKSNIWSIEPSVEVVEEEGGTNGAGKNLIVGGLVVGISLAMLPLFNALSGLLPDPADY